ncbi:HAMP domain-containing sensor histidine kinase [Candidatus Methylacidiphilum infernorum]|uniref:histidine kinase n=1 Tax=Methylacidiphilum infernorum (isolate V4) TaxID=481448 RepID=A9QPI8_METI4|nr:ATP-binding protein [Candidatus Methylacidiphilum infernorum]ABX56646.1 copper sensor histidine kinase [Methylacidiphilum infernorum V4]ACD82659.1 Signal transduction histidine kinase, contains HAMP domain [Methylacidiphilum infernorum V4]
MKSLPLRWRIALWTAFLVALALLSSGLVTGLVLYRELIENTDRELKSDSLEFFNLLAENQNLSLTAQQGLSQNFGNFEESSILEFAPAEKAPLYKSLLLKDKDLFVGHPLESFFYEKLNRSLYRIFYTQKNGYRLALGKNMASLYEILLEASHAYFLSAPFALLLATLGGWWISRKALLPIRHLASILEQLRASALHQRISIPTQDPDLKRLLNILNEMLARLEEAFQREIRLTADASHELKTPLTILKNELESALQRSDVDLQTEKTFLNLYEQVQTLSSLTQTLLFLSNLDRDSSLLKPTQLSIGQVLIEILEDAAILAAEKEITIEKDLADVGSLYADEDLIRRLLWNIFDNAIQYNTSKGFIEVKLRLTPTGHCLIQVSNSGPVVPAEERKNIFERFYRGQNAIGNGIAGHGLGLNLCREIVSAHKGEIRYDVDERGLNQITLLLPLSPNPPRPKKP